MIRKMIGEKVILSPLDSSEADIMAKWANDLDITLGTPIASHNVSLEKETEWLKKLEANGEDFYIIARDSKCLIGTIGIVKKDLMNQWAELGIMIGAKDYWHQGYGTEAMLLMCDFCFSILNCHTVRLEVYEFNRIALNCYRKLGFRECGRYHEAKKLAGQWFDCIHLELREDEFQSPYVARLIKDRLQGED